MLRFVWGVLLLGITALGVWLASSLVAFAGGPAGLACAVGVLLFPVVPLWWEKRATDAFYAKLKRSTRLLPKRRALTGPTRLALRTVAVNVAFIVALLGIWPKVAFAALVTRGDWFLADRRGPWVERTRFVLVKTASSLEWLHQVSRDNPNKRPEDAQTPVPDDVKPVASVVTPFGSGARWRPKDVEAPPKPELPPAEPPKPDTAYTVGSTSWPWPATVHPVVQGMTAGDETSPEAVVRFISARTGDPFERVKALHDWVVTRLRYDQASVAPGAVRKPQDAQAVFTSRLGVCEGYARLLVEFGRLSGDRIMFVTGEVREEQGALAPVGHAWNAVEIHGAWYLIDATWDDPVMADGHDAYRTDYLFIPPQLAGLNHLPDEPRWQLRDDPLSRAEFLRQPLATPGLAREHLVLKQPTSAVVAVGDTFTLELDNPARAWVLVRIGDHKCGPSNALALALSCPVERGSKQAVLFTNASEAGTYESIASFTLQ